MAPNPHYWLCERFGAYYRRAPPPTLPRLERREFGFGGWERKIEFRHMAFRNAEDLRQALVRDRPLYVSASSAYYEFPDGRPMPKKNWQGADLVFDLDAEAHDCAPFTCPACIHTVRENALRLIEDFLLPEFGLTRQELQVGFSGSRGFHVRAYKKELEPLGRDERREIVDYIEGTGLEMDAMFEERGGRLWGPSLSSSGWKRRIAHKLRALASDRAALAQALGMRIDESKQAKFIEAFESGNYMKIPRLNPADLKKKLEPLVRSSGVSISNQVDTDVNVTFDTTKILRMPDTIHGGSGLLAKTIPLGVDIGSYEPMQSALAFPLEPTEKVQTSRAIPAIEFGGRTMEALASGQVAELPQAYAIYLVCKKAAIPL